VVPREALYAFAAFVGSWLYSKEKAGDCGLSGLTAISGTQHELCPHNKWSAKEMELNNLLSESY
jgi:hypothetical protein